MTKEQLIEAVDGSLERLGTDFIDILHIHWPERFVPLYGAPEYLYELEYSDISSIREQLEALDALIKAGKIRYFGLSNETPYGVGVWTTTADLLGLPRPIVTQNAYNLLVRNEFETGMVEACSPRNGNIGLLAYSPLAGGALTGKYLDEKRVDAKARMRAFIGFMHRYVSPPAQEAILKYQEIADAFSLPLSVIALAFVYSRPFVSSTILGASSTAQLRDNVQALNLPIDKDLLESINKVYRQHRDPTRGVFEVFDPTVELVDPSKLPWGAKDSDVDPELDILINQRFARF